MNPDKGARASSVMQKKPAVLDELTDRVQNANPLVSIVCLAYNHETYIAQAIESFLLQVTDFPFVVLIHDDASTDGTAKIIREYEQQHPHIIMAIYQKENQYSKLGFQFIKRILGPLVRGRYYASCEGDDYWTDPYKLQKQVDYMEEHPDCGMVHTDADILYEASNKMVHNYHRSQRLPMPEDPVYDSLLKREYHVFNCTALTRLEDKYKVDMEPAKGFISWDTYIWLSLSRITKFHYLPESTAVRRIITESATQSSDVAKKLRFRQKEYELYQYFVDKYGCAPETERQLHVSFNNSIMSSAFLTGDTALLKVAKQKIIDAAGSQGISRKNRMYSTIATAPLLHKAFRSLALKKLGKYAGATG